jgi:hypothetical protein
MCVCVFVQNLYRPNSSHCAADILNADREAENAQNQITLGTKRMPTENQPAGIIKLSRAWK